MENKIKFQEQGNAIVNKEKNKIQDSLSQKTQERNGWFPQNGKIPNQLLTMILSEGRLVLSLELKLV